MHAFPKGWRDRKERDRNGEESAREGRNWKEQRGWYRPLPDDSPRGSRRRGGGRGAVTSRMCERKGVEGVEVGRVGRRTLHPRPLVPNIRSLFDSRSIYDRAYTALSLSLSLNRFLIVETADYLAEMAKSGLQ